MLAKNFRHITIGKFTHLPSILKEVPWTQFYQDYYLSDTLAISDGQVWFSRWHLQEDSRELQRSYYYQCVSIKDIHLFPHLITVMITQEQNFKRFLRFQNDKQNLDQIKKVANFLDK